MKKLIAITFRLICLPFFMCMTAIGLFYQLLRMSFLFVVNGGELIPYTKRMDKKTICDVFVEVQKLTAAK